MINETYRIVKPGGVWHGFMVTPAGDPKFDRIDPHDDLWVKPLPGTVRPDGFGTDAFYWPKAKMELLPNHDNRESEKLVTLFDKLNAAPVGATFDDQCYGEGTGDIWLKLDNNNWGCNRFGNTRAEDDWDGSNSEGLADDYPDGFLIGEVAVNAGDQIQELERKLSEALSDLAEVTRERDALASDLEANVLAVEELKANSVVDTQALMEWCEKYDMTIREYRELLEIVKGAK